MDRPLPPYQIAAIPNTGNGAIRKIRAEQIQRLLIIARGNPIQPPREQEKPVRWRCRNWRSWPAQIHCRLTVVTSIRVVGMGRVTMSKGRPCASVACRRRCRLAWSAAWFNIVGILSHHRHNGPFHSGSDSNRLCGRRYHRRPVPLSSQIIFSCPRYSHRNCSICVCVRWGFRVFVQQYRLRDQHDPVAVGFEGAPLQNHVRSKACNPHCTRSGRAARRLSL